MQVSIMQVLFARDLKRLRDEIASYNSEIRLWQTEKQIANSGGNLCLHLIGNLNGYIGNELGGISYQRNRDLEFSQKGIAKKDLLAMIDETSERVRQALTSIHESRLNDDFPVKVFDEPRTTGFMLVHFATHLAYHLGQINYHRRMLDEKDQYETRKS